MQKKAFSFAVGALLFSAGAVSAATLTDNLNLRNGPGLRYDTGYIAPRYGYGYGYAQTQSSSWAPNAGMGYGGGWWNR